MVFDNKSCIQRSVLDKRTLLAYHLIILKNFETQKAVSYTHLSQSRVSCAGTAMMAPVP